jgi:hypothetical protein
MRIAEEQAELLKALAERACVPAADYLDEGQRRET